uniref:Uncharacterized protein n=1 Tax=Neogobius melanostomus TaxID=47308 RepID=A0A8C6THJ6_9GOBI
MLISPESATLAVADRSAPPLAPHFLFLLQQISPPARPSSADSKLIRLELQRVGELIRPTASKMNTGR